jgi:homoserine dehydrogenase
MNRYSWGLVGYKPATEKANNIGREIVRQISRTHQRLKLEKSPRFIQRQNGLFEADGLTPRSEQNIFKLRDLPDVVFVALPSSDDGEPAYSIIKHCLKRGTKVITCEKGALASYFQQLSNLSDNFRSLGINASVGGGSRLMEKSRADFHDPQNICEIHLAINGTLTYVFSSIGPKTGTPIPIDQAVKQAIELGYAEPGETDIKSIIRGEAEGDVPKKVAIFLNQSGLLGSNPPLSWSKLSFKVTDSDIGQVIKEAKSSRFIVSIYPAPSSQVIIKDIISGFDVTHHGWRIIGGFRNIEHDQRLNDLAKLKDAENGVIVALGPQDALDGVNLITGPGAGPKPTVNTMLDDYLRIMRAS